jgi:TDG/mug DNA glycosylase family protein
MEKNDSTIVEGFPPLMCHEPRVLILGTIPGEKSISANEYYCDNRNRMWKMLAELATQKLPTNYSEKKVLLEQLHVVLWDYYQSVERTNSTDKGILKGTPNDIVGFIRKNPTITKIAINGYKKYNMFGEKLQNQFGQSIKVFRLPETSGSNASWTLEKLCQDWSVVFEL